jgi:ribose/xylose/arabinose/galactoside ABC-type transport system permease subunit
VDLDMTETQTNPKNWASKISWQRVKSVAMKYGSYGTLALLILVGGLLSPQFLNVTNLFITFRQAAALGIVALGQTFVIISGGIDLAVGSLLSFSLVLVCNNMQYSDARIIPLLLIVVALGAIVGLIDSFFITKLRVPAIVMTLGMQTALQGALLMYSKALPLDTLTDHFRVLGLGKLGVVPMPVIAWAVVAAIAVVLLNHTSFGRYVYAVGGNPEATRLSGVNTAWVRMSAYIISGITAALAGYLLAARIGVGDEFIGAAYTLDSIAAVAIGGTSMSGGRGNILSTIAGVLILSLLYNLLMILGFDLFWQYVIKGLVVLAGVILYTRKRSY